MFCFVTSLLPVIFKICLSKIIKNLVKIINKNLLLLHQMQASQLGLIVFEVGKVDFEFIPVELRLSSTVDFQLGMDEFK